MCGLCSTPTRPFVGPSRVLVGQGSLAAAAAELNAIGVQPHHGQLLLVADTIVLDLGLHKPLVAAFEDAGYTVYTGPTVGGEPSPDTISGLLPPEDTTVAAVVALGGGSALDAAKLVSAALVNTLDLTVGLKPDAVITPGPPIVAIPTTAGTGAEATAVAMLWHNKSKRMFVHAYLVPRIVILDPNLLAALPKSVTAAGGFDAIGHAIESMLSTFRTPLTSAAAREALQHLSWAVPAAYDSGGSDARYGTALGAYQAGLALNASVVLGHSLAYAIASRTGLAHGVTVAMALPYCLAHARPACAEQIAEMAEIVCGQPDSEKLIEWLVDNANRMQIPSSLSELGVAREDLDAIATDCVDNYPRPNHPVPIDQPSVANLLQRMYDGEPLEAWRENAIRTDTVRQ